MVAERFPIGRDDPRHGSRQAVAKWERGERDPTGGFLERVKRFLQVSIGRATRGVGGWPPSCANTKGFLAFVALEISISFTVIDQILCT